MLKSHDPADFHANFAGFHREAWNFEQRTLNPY